MKNIYLIFLLFFSLKFYSQNNISSDSIYLNIDEFKFENFKDVYIQGFSFQNPAIDVEMSMSFQPTIGHVFDGNKKIKGKVKKISEYVKRSYDKEKKLDTYTLYNENGQATLKNESGYINTYFSYDSNKRLSKKIRVVRNDTISKQIYEYNDKNQIVKYSEYIFEYDNEKKIIVAKNINPNSKYKRKYIYNDNNVVRMEDWDNDKIIGSRENVYSENNNLIKEVFGDYIVFNSYNKHNQKIKSVTFINKKLNNIREFDYDEKGNIILDKFQFAIDKKNGTKSEVTHQYKYDVVGNKIYDLNSGENAKSPTEYFYEIEYY